MKNEIIKIAKDLEQGTIDLNTARNLLLGLFDVSGSLLVIGCNYHTTWQSHKSMRFAANRSGCL